LTDAEWQEDLDLNLLGAVRAIRGSLKALRQAQSAGIVGVSRVILFGSFARDEAAPGSDLDLLVEGLDPARLLEATIAVQDLLDERLGTAPGGAGLPTLDLDLVPRQLVRAPIRRRSRFRPLGLAGCVVRPSWPDTVRAGSPDYARRWPGL